MYHVNIYHSNMYYRFDAHDEVSCDFFDLKIDLDDGKLLEFVSYPKTIQTLMFWHLPTHVWSAVVPRSAQGLCKALASIFGECESESQGHSANILTIHAPLPYALHPVSASSSGS